MGVDFSLHDAESGESTPNLESFGLQLYEDEVQRIPKLNRLEEIEQVELHIAGDMTARARLIESHLWLVLREAKKRKHWPAPIGDLVQAGNIGLINCIDGYKPRRGKWLRHVAILWIYETMRRSLNYEHRLIRLPQNIMQIVHKIDRGFRERDSADSPPLTIHEIATIAGLGIEETQQYLNWRQTEFVSIESLECKVERPISETLCDPLADSVDEIVSSRALMSEIIRLINDLDHSRNAAIIRMRYGIACDRSLTLQQLGDKFGITRERVRQIEVEGLQRLRSIAEAKCLQDYFK